MSLKTIFKTFVVTGLIATAGMAAAHAAGGPSEGSVCMLINQMGTVFRTLRTLAFVGAAFCIAGWAWGFIAEKPGEGVLDNLKKKGIALLVGFTLLFGVGVILQFLVGTGGGSLCGINNW